MAPSGGEHGQIAASFTAKLFHHVEQHDLGIVFGAETGFFIARDPDTVRAPDTAFVRKERAQAIGRITRYWPEAPDLAFEAISPSDILSEVEAKAMMWLQAGTQMAVVANPRNRTVSIYRPAKEPQVFGENAIIDFSPVVPGFQLSVKAILR
jgi:Uma2 family endonuclease